MRHQTLTSHILLIPPIRHTTIIFEFSNDILQIFR